jgi:hypothetical protein
MRSIQPTEPRPQPINPHIRGYFDPRRIVTVNQIATEQSLNFTIPSASFDSNSPAVSTKNAPRPFGGHFGPGPVHLDPIDANARQETLPGSGEFGVGPVIIPGETIGDRSNTKGQA